MSDLWQLNIGRFSDLATKIIAGKLLRLILFFI